MNKSAFILAAAALAVAFASPASAQTKTPIRFCVGGPGGNYAKIVQPKVAEQIAEKFDVTMVNTKGSPEILERLLKPVTSPDACDMGVAQMDALLAVDANPLTVEAVLYAEYAHLICRRNLDVKTIDDVINKKVAIGTGSAFSGNEVFWQGLGRADKRYQAVVTRPIGIDPDGAQALRREDVGCVLAVQGIRSKAINDFIDQVDAADLILVSLTDKDFAKRTITIGSRQEKLYFDASIPADTYTSIQPKGFWGGSKDVETTAVKAVLLSRNTLRNKMPADVRDYLASGIIKADKAIKSEISNPSKPKS